MTEPCPPHLDEDGKEIWELCSWIIQGKVSDMDVQLQLQALAIRRELRLESEKNQLREAVRELVVQERLGFVYSQPRAIAQSIKALAALAEDNPCT